MSRSRALDAGAMIDRVEATRDHVRAQARAAMGVTGREETEPLRSGIARSGAGWYTLIALSVLVIVDEFQGFGFAVLGPEISRAIGVSKGGLAGLLALKTVAITLAALPMAAWVQKRPRRAFLAVATAFAWAATTLFTGFVTSSIGMLFILLADGISSGSVAALHPPLLIDAYPPAVRVRALSFYRGAAAAGTIIGPVIVGICAGVFGFTWRGVFLVMGITCVIGAFVARRLRDPGFGRWDADEVREAVRAETGVAEASAEADDFKLGFFEIVRRLFLLPTIRRVLASYAVLGMLLIPLNTYLFFFLRDRWGLGPGQRGLFFATLPLFAIAALVRLGRKGEEMFTSDPARLIRATALALGIGVVALAAGIFSPVFPLTVLLIGVAIAAIALLTPTLNIVTLAILPPEMRPHAAALTNVFLAAVGGFGGLILLSGIDRRFGTAGAIASLAVPGVVAALVLRSAARSVQADLDRMIDEMVEQEEIRELTQAGEQLPMLACRGIDFFYGNVQVLFGVDFTVDDGEMVALLGTNGAGKSTLLRVISGLGLPVRGTVRFRGGAITYLDAERRLNLGITQVPGGRAVFGPLSVAENLRMWGFSLGRDKRAVDEGIQRSFDVFPRLAERRDQVASTLSGGEQQMLGLAKALILQPRLLLIDELSLGLAPKIVGQLLQMVRAINEEGAAVVLVEQSVNVALSLVQHAYFMEKGEIRFDGPAADLLQRADLLRSVFLEGAAQKL